jgi:MFS family permease
VSASERATVTWGQGIRPLTAGLVTTVTLVAFESLSVATILPVVSRQLGDVRLYGWVFSAFFLSSLVGIVLAGRMSDRRGVVLPLAGGLAVFGAGLAIAGIAPDMPVLVAGRVVQGLGAGAVPATAYAAIGRTYAESVRPKMFAVLSTAWVVPGVIGPALAAQVATHLSWRWVFLGLLPLVAVAGVMIVPALSAVPSQVLIDAPKGPPGELLAAAAVTAGAGALLAGLTTGSPLPAALLVGLGLVVMVPAVRRLTPPGTWRARPGLPAAVLIRGLLTFAFFAGDAYVPLTLVTVRHMSTTYAGLALTVSTVTWTAGSWLQARVLRRLGPRLLITSGLTVVVVSLAGMASVLWSAIPVGTALGVWALAGFGMGLAYSPISVTALGWARPGQEGRTTAALQLCDVLGTGLGTGVAGASVAIAHQQGASLRLGLLIAFSLAGGVGILGVLVSPRLPRRAGRDTEGRSVGIAPLDLA